MDEKVATKLREPFKAGEIGKLPRVTCPKCSRGQCDEHSKAKCSECGAYVSTRHIHLDYVGHADVTSRLIEADPGWNWEPRAEDEHGLPLFDTDVKGAPVGLWIKLTVGGVTRLGYGSCPSGQNDAVKVLIGDALRNAAMRFGVALDLWAKGDRADPTAENATASGGQAARRQSRPSAGDAFDQANPAKPQNGQHGGGNGGQVSRPAQRQQPAQAKDAEPDPDAQGYADEAHEARTVPALQGIHIKAREAHKLAAVIRNPATGGTGGLGQFINWRKAALEDEAAALAGLQQAASAAGMATDELDGHVKTVTGASVEAASAAQLREAAKALKTGAAV